MLYTDFLKVVRFDNLPTSESLLIQDICLVQWIYESMLMLGFGTDSVTFLEWIYARQMQWLHHVCKGMGGSQDSQLYVSFQDIFLCESKWIEVSGSSQPRSPEETTYKLTIYLLWLKYRRVLPTTVCFFCFLLTCSCIQTDWYFLVSWQLPRRVQI